MGEGKVILVTGAAGFWGRRVAEKLLEAPGVQVIGLDPGEPDEKIKGLDFIQADIRNPLLLDLLKTEQVDTVCHLHFVDSARPSEAAFDANVMGAMKLFAACREAGVRKIVLKSSTAVYGARPENPSFLNEDAPLNGSRAYGYTRDLVEIEAFCNGFRRQAPETLLTILRFASIVGPEADTPMTRFLSQPKAPVLLGFDPMMQVIHEEDVVGALAHAVLEDAPGVFNVAAEAVLPLTKLMALAGKLPLPVFHPFAYWGAAALGSSRVRGGDYLPIELDYLRYPWVGDLGRMRDELQFAPGYTAEQALREFAGRQRLQPFRTQKAALAYDEQRLRDTLERRSRQRQQDASEVDMQEADDE
jgi:UDP-glucose 4-epimerase